MKHVNYARCLVLVVIFLATFKAYSETFEVDGIWYGSGRYDNVPCVYVTYGTNYIGDITIPDSIIYNGVTYPVMWIGDRAFYNCTNLTSISLPNNIRSIQESAFYNCRKLNRISLPYPLTYIGNNAFYYCENLSDVICRAITPPTMGNYQSVYPTYYMATLHVPEKSVEAYKATDWWSHFINIVGDASSDDNTPNAPVTDKCDTNGDGEVNIADVNMVIDAILNK